MIDVGSLYYYSDYYSDSSFETSWRINYVGALEELRSTVTISGRTSFTNNTSEGGGGKNQVIVPSVNTGDERSTCVHDSHDSRNCGKRAYFLPTCTSGEGQYLRAQTAQHS